MKDSRNHEERKPAPDAMDRASEAHKRLRVGFNASPFTDPCIRGFHRHTRNLILNLHREYGDQLEIFLYSNRDLCPEAQAEFTFAKIRVLPLRPYGLWEQVALPILMALDSLQVYHSTTNFGIPLLRPFFTSTVLTLHDLFAVDEMYEALDHEMSLPKKIEKFASQLWQRFLWYTSKSADAIISVNHYARQELVNRYRGLPRKVCVITNGVEASFHPGNISHALLEKYSVQTPYILYIGSFGDRDNLGCLLDSYQSMAEQLEAAGISRPQLLLTGGASAPPQGLVREIKSQPEVHRLGHVPDEELRELYRGALFGVIPSKHEGFGLTALEFMASGTPVIAAHANAFPEILGNAAPFFDPRNCYELTELMHRMVVDEQWRSSWIKKGIERSAQFTWIEAAKQTFAIYQSLVIDSKNP